MSSLLGLLQVVAVETRGVTGIPVLDQILAPVLVYTPRIVGALVMLIVAYIAAYIVSFLVRKGLQAVGIENRLATPSNPHSGRHLISTLASVAFYVVFLLFMPAILDALGLQNVFSPLQVMIANILGFLPNLLGAALIFVIGFLLAGILRQVVTGLLEGLGANQFAARVGLGQTFGAAGLAGLIGTILYVLVLIPVITAALNALNLPNISQPISNMLNRILEALPNIFGAALILVIAYFIGKIVSNLVANVLAGVGFDRIPAALGLGNFGAGAPTTTTTTVNNVSTGGATSGSVADATNDFGTGVRNFGANAVNDLNSVTSSSPNPRTASGLVGNLVLISIMLFAVIEAAHILNFTLIADLARDLTAFGANLITGLIIFAVGLYLSQLAARFIQQSGVSNAGTLANVARAAILIFTGAIALSRMGLAEGIVNLAFGLTLGAIAVAAAIAFGIGGQDFARRVLSRYSGSFESTASSVAQKSNQPNTIINPTTGGTL